MHRSWARARSLAGVIARRLATQALISGTVMLALQAASEVDLGLPSPFETADRPPHPAGTGAGLGGCPAAQGGSVATSAARRLAGLAGR